MRSGVLGLKDFKAEDVLYHFAAAFCKAIIFGNCLGSRSKSSLNRKVPLDSWISGSLKPISPLALQTLTLSLGLGFRV